MSFGTSGHRGTSLKGTFTEAHVLAISEAIARHRKAEGITGPLFVARDTHALSEPAFHTAISVLQRARDRRARRRRRRLHADARAQPRDPDQPGSDGIVLTPSHNPPEDGGYKYNPPSGGPAGTDVTKRVEAEANELLGRRDRHRGGADHAARLRERLRRRPPERDRHRRDPRGRRAHRRRPAGRRVGRLLPGDQGPARAQPRGRQRRGRPDLPLRPARPRRQDPHGLLLAVRDERSDRVPRPLRRRGGLRPRRRPPRDRHADLGPDEPEPLPRGGDRLPVRRRARLAGRGHRQDARLLEHDRQGRRGASGAAWSRSRSASSGSSTG